MTPYFAKEENWSRMWEEMESWRGTPYRHLQMTKGRGADCTLFIGGVWKACNVLDDVIYDYYPKDWHVHTEEELVLDSIFRHYQDHCKEGLVLERFGPLPVEELLRGDLITFNYPKRNIIVSHHAALWIGTIMKTRQRKIMINSIENQGVVHMQYGSHWENRLTNVFRVMEA
jgi:cell wall-associated NlpC family hydrolase